MNEHTDKSTPMPFADTLPREKSPITVLVQKYGTESQRERYLTGRLPDVELRDIVRVVLFHPLNGAPRFRQLKAEDLHHEPKCRAGGSVAEFSTDPVKIDTDYQGSLTDRQWLTWKEIEALLKAGFPPAELDVDHAVSKLRRHVVECSFCGAKRNRVSVLVSAVVYGMTLSREYAL